MSQPTTSPLKNPEAETLCINVADVYSNKKARQELFKAFTDSHPNLKKWEASAISNRICEILRERGIDPRK